jgi:hypothetical protein
LDYIEVWGDFGFLLLFVAAPGEVGPKFQWLVTGHGLWLHLDHSRGWLKWIYGIRRREHLWDRATLWQQGDFHVSNRLMDSTTSFNEKLQRKVGEQAEDRLKTGCV